MTTKNDFVKSLATFIATSTCLALLTSCGSNSELTRAAQEVDVQALVAQLNSPDEETRVQACISLATGLENSADAVDALCETIKNDKSARVREMAGYAIYEMGEEVGKKAMPTIKERFGKDPSPKVNNQLFNLWQLIDPDSAPDIKRANI